MTISEQGDGSDGRATEGLRTLRHVETEDEKPDATEYGAEYGVKTVHVHAALRHLRKVTGNHVTRHRFFSGREKSEMFARSRKCQKWLPLSDAKRADFAALWRHRDISFFLLE